MKETQNATTEVEVNIKVRDTATGEMKEALSTKARLIKVNHILQKGERVDDSIYISITPGEKSNFADAVISVNSASKLTKVELE